MPERAGLDASGEATMGDMTDAFVVLECRYESGHEWDVLRVVGPFPSEAAAKAWVGEEPPGAGQEQGSNYWEVVSLHDPAATTPAPMRPTRG